MQAKTRLLPEVSFALEAFLLDAKARQLRPASIRYYSQQLNKFTAYAAQNGAYTVDAITPTMIRAYLSALQDQGLSTASVVSAARAAKAFLNFCVAEEMLDVSPMRRVKMPRQDKPQPIALTPEEVTKILGACRCQRDRAIVLTLLDTGCRAQELLAWRVGDVNLATGVVAVTRTKNRDGRIGFLGYQARKAVLLYVAERRHVTPDSALWVTVKGYGETPLTYHGLKQVFRLLKQATGVPVCAHAMRRTFITWALRGGMNLFEVQKLAGHSDLQVLRHYAAVTETDLHNAHGRVALADSVQLPDKATQKKKGGNRGR